MQSCESWLVIFQVLPAKLSMARPCRLSIFETLMNLLEAYLLRTACCLVVCMFWTSLAIFEAQGMMSSSV